MHVFQPSFREELQCVPERERFAFDRTEHEPLDEKRAQVILDIMASLWGGEERALLKEVASKLDAVVRACNDITEYLGIAKGAYFGTKIVPIETLNERFTLKRPIFAVLEQSEGTVTATYYECELFGEGESEFEALDDLRQSLVEYYLELRDSLETLGPLPAKHLRVLSELVCEK